MRYGLLIVGVLLALPLGAAEVSLPVNERFASAEVRETPDFQRHVSPLLSRLGCNGRACHGSFQGQGGFQLSLFGYDFAVDHQALLASSQNLGRPRVDRSRPTESLILQKPTLSIDHEGGEIFAKTGWEYRLLSRWIEAGAKRGSREQRLLRLEADPPELTFAKPGEDRQLRIVARWEDGTIEDVTCLCRFQTNDDGLATVSPAGHVSAVGRGDSHVIVFYDNGVLAIPVLIPVTDRVGGNYPVVATPTRVDELIVAKLRTLGIVPAELCTDAEKPSSLIRRPTNVSGRSTSCSTGRVTQPGGRIASAITPVAMRHVRTVGSKRPCSGTCGFSPACARTRPTMKWPLASSWPPVVSRDNRMAIMPGRCRHTIARSRQRIFRSAVRCRISGLGRP